MTATTSGGPARAAGPRTHMRSERRSEAIAGYSLIALPLLIFLVLNIGQIGYALYISFWDWGVRGPRELIGLENYQALFENPVFWKAVQNTLYYAALVVPLQMALGLFLAVIVNQRIRGRRSSGPRTTSRRSRARPPSPSCSCSSSRPAACSTACVRRSASTRSSPRLASGPTRTGSGTAGPP